MYFGVPNENGKFGVKSENGASETLSFVCSDWKCAA